MKKLKRLSILITFALVLSMITPSIMPAFSNTTNVEAATTKVKINKKNISLSIGKTYKLKITGTSKTVKWSSSDSSVAAVSSKGKVTAKKAGTSTVTAAVNNQKYTCTVVVKAADSSEQTTVYGKVTAISGSKVTLSLGTMNTPPTGKSGNQSSNGAQPSQTPGVQPSGIPAAPSGNSNNTSDSTSSGSTNSTQGQGSNGQPGGAPDLLTLTGETVTINITDTSILSKQSMQGPNGSSSDSSSNKSTASSNSTTSAKSDTSSSSASLSDISTGSILKVTYKSSVNNLVSVVIIGAGQGGGSQAGGPQAGGTQAGGSSNSSSSTNNGTSAYTLKDGEALTSGTYTSTNIDENAIRADSVKASLSDATVSKTDGAASSNDASSFYGLNSAILALGSATLDITGGSVTASAEGANGVFAYGGATINIKNTKVNVTGGNAGGIEVAGGGIMNATNLTVNSTVKAAIRSDRGGGTMTVNGGTYTTSGSSGAPAIYSTADITVSDAALAANDSEAVVVEGLNSVKLNNCTVTGNMTGTYGSSSGENIHNVMLYQSMSGDAEVGNSSFTMNGGTLTSKNGDMFYVTNTDCVISLSDVSLTPANGTKLLVVAGNDGSRGWGTVGSNGGNCTFKISKQTLTGDITVDKISKLTMSIADSSTFTGSINSDKTTASTCSVTLDSSSKWILTADSYVTEFNGSMSNVDTNGHTLYVNGVAKN